MDSLQPVRKSWRIALRVAVLSGIRRVTEHNVEARVVAFKHLRELDIPVERVPGVPLLCHLRSHRRSDLQRAYPGLPGRKISPLQLAACPVTIRSTPMGKESGARRIA